MAKRRMFSTDLMTSDKIMSMSIKAQYLYFHLNLMADDDGFIGNLNGVLRLVKATKAHICELEKAGLVIRFESGVAAITHWLVHNQLRKDRYVETRYTEEKRRLKVENGVYKIIENDKNEPEEAQIFGNQMATQVSIGKLSQVKDSQVEVSIVKDSQAKDSIVENSQAKDSIVELSKDKKEDDALNHTKSAEKNKTSSEETNKESEHKKTDREQEEREKTEVIINEKGREESDDKVFIHTLSDQERERYNNTLFNIRMYFIKEHKNFDSEDFIYYNEKRFWKGKNGESVLDNYVKYIECWVKRDYKQKGYA